MEKQIAYCGLICTDCEAYIATKNNDDEKRKETAALWKKGIVDIKPEDINCNGCLDETGRIFHYCTICEVRKCGREKKVVNCAYCKDYICEKLGQFFKMDPVMKANLDEIRKGLKK
jgi:hypothetical protein